MRGESSQAVARLWRAAAVVACVLLGPMLFAVDDPAPSTTEPIVLEPSDADEPPVVPLGEHGNSDGDDPLLIGEFTLTDQDGKPFSSQQLAGHPWVASFIFTRCAGYCPNLIAKLRLEIVDRVKDPEVRFVTISVDPEHDTPKKLKQYAEVFGADPARWTFLTGDQETIYRLVLHGFRLPVAEIPGEDRRPGFEVAHSLSLIHIGPDGRVMGKYDSRDDQQILSLRRVLNGQIETPEENRPKAAVENGATLGGRDGPQDQIGTASASPPGSAADSTETDDVPVGVRRLPDWAARLPTTNAMLNGLATVLLVMGYVAIKRGSAAVHKRFMLMAFGTSVAFLACYLTYHFALRHYTGTHGKTFAGTGPVRTAYFALLISHVLLAMAVPVLAVVTIRRGLRSEWAAHRRIARVTFPIWLYVSVTGVIIYGMLYHWPVGVSPHL